MKIRRRPERWRLRFENSNLPVVSLFPLFQRGNRLREQAVRGLNFSFRCNPVSFGYKRNGVSFMLKRADNIRPYVMKAFSKKQRHFIAKCLCYVFNYFCSSSMALRRISFAYEMDSFTQPSSKGTWRFATLRRPR